LYVPVVESPEVIEMKRCERNIKWLLWGIVGCLTVSLVGSFGFLLAVDFMLWLK
tara:strand:+ start:339 stop:500 length:162 start_codon:yes stop_codon:yes gene_type:complete